MRTNKLTPLQVSSFNDPGRYADGGGLYLQVTRWEKDGVEWSTKSWLFRYMKDGRARQMGLGSVDTFSLKEARQRARLQRQLLADGADPLAARQRVRDAERVEAARAVTFRDAAERYIKAHQAGWKNEKHADQWGNTLSTYAFSIIGSLPVAAVDTALVMKVLQQPVKAGKSTVPLWNAKTETASRVRGRIERVLDWARVQGMRQGENPARWKAHLDKLLPARTKVAKVRHQPAMPWRDVPTFMGELRANEAISARALEFIVLTATRTGESIGARWEEVDLDDKLWTIPPERTKSGREHRVPLSDRVVEILKTLPRASGGFVFPGARAKQPLSNMAALELLRGLRPGLTVHGFRSSFRDWCAEATNFPREIAEAALGHVLGNKVEAAYQRGDLLEKRRRLMQAWEGFCSKPAGNGNGGTTPQPRRA
jgi:integrase